MTLPIVEASHPRFCAVCRGAEAVVIHPVGAPELAAELPCPHCGPLHRPLVLNTAAPIREHHEEIP